MVENFLLPSCLNCEHYQKNKNDGLPREERVTDTQLCSKYGVAPPHETVVYGCNQWVQDIPF